MADEGACKSECFKNSAPYMATMFAFAGVGILCNLLLLWIWSGERKYNAITFLFKYLAVGDCVFLALFPLTMVYYVGEVKFTIPVDHALYAQHAASLAQGVSVHTTLLISVSRWVAVRYPFKVRICFQRSRVFSACVVFFVWCFMIKVPEFVAGRDKSTSLFIAAKVNLLMTGNILPCVVMLYFSFGIFREIVRQSRKKHELHAGKSHRRQHPVRLLLPVIVISVSTFLAYFVGSIAICVAFAVHGYGIKLNRIAFVTYYMHMLNASMNFFVYLAGSSRFRDLLRTRLNCGTASEASWTSNSAQMRMTCDERGSSLYISPGASADAACLSEERLETESDARRQSKVFFVFPDESPSQNASTDGTSIDGKKASLSSDSTFSVEQTSQVASEGTPAPLSEKASSQGKVSRKATSLTSVASSAGPPKDESQPIESVKSDDQDAEDVLPAAAVPSVDRR